MKYPTDNGKPESVSDFKGNYGTGWIKLYRSIKKHWIHENPLYFRAWCDILLEVNHEGKKVLIENELIDCKRGQAVYSLDSWRDVFGKNEWSMQNVRTFFKLLKNDGMINTEGLRKTTRLTVINYDTYQGELTNRQHENQQTANKQLTTTKECKEDVLTKVSAEKPPLPEKMNAPEIVKYFAALYQYYNESEYIISWKKDTGIIQQIWIPLGKDIFPIIDHYLSLEENQKVFWTTKERTISNLRWQINAIKEHWKEYA